MNKVSTLNRINPRYPARIGQLLLDSGKLSLENTDQIVSWQKKQGLRFGDAAVQLGLVTEVDVQTALAEQAQQSSLGINDCSLSTKLAAAHFINAKSIEEYRRLRSQLGVKWFDAGHKILTVVGVDTSTLSSSVVANLAIAFAQLGERVLVVDCNVRNPEFQHYFSVSTPAGLADMLLGQTDHSVIARVGTIPNLWVLHAGSLQPGSPDIFSGQYFAKFIENSNPRFDVILFSAPPINEFADAQLISKASQGVLLVAEKNITKLASLEKAKAEFYSLGIDVIGCVLAEA